MHDDAQTMWPLGREPGILYPIPERMMALTIHRDQYGPPRQSVRLEEVPTPRLRPDEPTGVLVAILATGPNFNTNFAALGLPVPVFGRGDPAAVHIPGSDALGLVVDAGPGAKTVKAGQAVILDSWTGRNIRGYETHDGFNAQFAVVPEERAIPVPNSLLEEAPEQLAAMMLTYGTAYRAVVERLAVQPGDSVLLMGGGKGTSFAGAQIAKTLGARVILMGSNPELGQALIGRGIADAFVDRRSLPANVFGVLPPDAEYGAWCEKTAPFRQAVWAANGGRPIDKIFEHTGGINFPLLVSALAPGGRLAFFGATGGGLKGEYKETFFYEGRRFVVDARWVWMRQKQVIFRNAAPHAILAEIGLLPGRRGLIWGADAYAAGFAEAALERGTDLAVIASKSRDAEGIAALMAMGIPESHIIDRDAFSLPEDMPDPLTEQGRGNPAYGPGFMDPARQLGRALWEVFGPRVSPDFVIDRPDQATLHFSTFLARDYDERDDMPCGWVIVQGASDLSILGSHMYRSSQAREVVRLLAEKRIVMEPGDLEVTDLAGLPGIQQKMLEGKMEKPKGAALVQSGSAGRWIAEFQAAYLGRAIRVADTTARHFLTIHMNDGVAIVTIWRPDALNALSSEVLAELAGVADEIERTGTIAGEPVRALVLQGTGRAFAAGADVTGFYERDAAAVTAATEEVLRLYDRIEALPVPVLALIDGFALGGGNELAMSTHYRIVTENARIGQPEVKLGIIPGWGGMQRLPRLIGPARAAEMCCNGEPIDGPSAVILGAADAFCSSASALPTAFRLAREMADGLRSVPRRDWDAIAATQAADLAALFARGEVIDLLSAPAPDTASAADGTSADVPSADLPAARRYAARVALEAIRAGYELGFAQGLKNDARLFGQIAASPSGQHWIGRFLAKDAKQGSFLTVLPPG